MLLVFPRSFITETMVLPSDNNFVFSDTFFLVIFFCGPIGRYFSIFCEVSRVGKSGGFGWRHKVEEATVKCASGRSRSRFTAAGKTPTFFPAPLTSQKRCIIPNQWAEKKKKLLTRDIKNYSPSEEVTHSAETPLYLWYDVFIPQPLTNFQGTTKKFQH